MTLVAALAATLGWLGQQYVNRLLARKQHTATILLSMRNSELYNTNVVNIRSKFGIRDPLTAEHVAEFDAHYYDRRKYIFDEENHRVHFPPEYSVFFYLNFVESIANAIFEGDLDEKMARLPLEPTVFSAVKRFWPILVNDLKLERYGDMLADPNESYATLYNLALRWGLTEGVIKSFYKDNDSLIWSKATRDAVKAGTIPRPTWSRVS